MRLLARTFLLSIVLMACTSVATAADYYVVINNQTGYTIRDAYVSPAKSADWENDVLTRVIPNGTSSRINLTGYNSSIFDIKLVDTDNDTYTFWNVDVARQDITVTINDID